VRETALEFRHQQDVAPAEWMFLRRDGRQAHADQEDRAHQVGRGVEDERASDTDPLHEPASRERAEAQRDAPGHRGERVGVVQVVLADGVGQRRGPGRVEEDADRHLQDDQDVEDRQVGGLPDEEESEDDQGAGEIRGDHQQSSRQAVCDGPGERSERRGREQSQGQLGTEEDPDADHRARAAEAADQDEARDAVEPIAGLADELGQPEAGELGIPGGDGEHGRQASGTFDQRP